MAEHWVALKVTPRVASRVVPLVVSRAVCLVATMAATMVSSRAAWSDSQKVVRKVALRAGRWERWWVATKVFRWADSTVDCLAVSKVAWRVGVRVVSWAAM